MNVSGHSTRRSWKILLAMGEHLRNAKFNKGDVKVYSNVTTEPGDNWPDLLEKQLMSPVRWTESIQNMRRDGINKFIECGSGEVLSGLLRRIDKEAVSMKVVDTATLAEVAEQVKGN
ncbi:MAG: hypothetical protein R2688_03850 [Fimbriimonadaceae bacterium]